MDSENRTININVPKGSVCRTSVSHMKILKGKEYCRMFSDPIQELMADKTMTLSSMRVLFYMASSMDFDNRVCESQASMSNNLDMTRQLVTKSLKQLQEGGQIVVLFKIGTQNVYMINPNLFFKTRAINLSRLKDYWEEVTVVSSSEVC